MDCDWRGTQPASMLASQVSDTPEEAASWRCVRPTARRRALIAAETSEAVVMIVLMQLHEHGNGGRKLPGRPRASSFEAYAMRSSLVSNDLAARILGFPAGLSRE